MRKYEINYLRLQIKDGRVKTHPRIIEHIIHFSCVIETPKKLGSFLGCINYIFPFLKNIYVKRTFLQKLLREGQWKWTGQHKNVVRPKKI